MTHKHYMNNLFQVTQFYIQKGKTNSQSEDLSQEFPFLILSDCR